MDTVPFPECPKCGGTKHRLRSVHPVHDLNDPLKVVAKVYTFTCEGCSLSFTEEVKTKSPKSGQE
jgi:predicted nucleic-acid-binding Zn-ribbon protein